MTEKTANPLEAVSSLLEERQRYEVWLSTLESRRATTPPHVYSRVHADYDKRLAEVTDQLTSRTGELQEMAKELRTRIDRLQEEENRRRDERAEAELRATVGEFTPDQWNELRERNDGEIVKLSAEATAMREELTRVEELLRTAASPRRSRESAAVPAPGSAASSAGRPASGPAGAPTVQRGEERPAASERPQGGQPGMDTRGFDELAFLNSVVDTRDSGRTRPPAEPTATPSRTPTPAAPGVRQPTPAAPAAASSAPAEAGSESTGGRTTVPGRRMPEPSSAPAPVAPPAPGASGGEGNLGGPSHARESIPSFLKDVPNEQVKTLRCQECGTMNYPTEWYCERCGGELAAM